MKKLECEMCGSHDLLKQDGVFVCQHCGCKYTVEEARKLMSDDVVTVKVDNHEMIENYLEIASNALSSKNYKEAESYSNRVLEVEPQNPKAWFIKGKAAGWQSTLGNNRVFESVECWSKTVEYASDEEKQNYRLIIREELRMLLIGFASTSADVFSKDPSEHSYNTLVDVRNLFDPIIVAESKVQLNLDLDKLCTSIAKIMKDAAINGSTVADKYYGPGKEDMNQYAYSTWIERQKYCVFVLQQAATIAKNASVISSICYEGKKIIDRVLSSECYKLEINEFGSRYVPDARLNPSSRMSWQEMKGEFDSIRREYERKSKEKEEKEIRDRITAFWKTHEDEKKTIETEIKKIINLDDDEIPMSMSKSNLTDELSDLLQSDDEEHLTQVLDEIKEYGTIFEARKKSTFEEIAANIVETNSSANLKQIKEELGSFGDYQNASELIFECERLIPIAEQREARLLHEKDLSRLNGLEKKIAGTRIISELKEIDKELEGLKDSVDITKAREKVQKSIEDIKKRKFKTIAIIAAFIVVIIVVIVGLGLSKDVRKYNAAKRLLNNGEYDKAAVEFKELGDYKDSKDMITECSYAKACKNLENGDYDEARNGFLALRNYKDSEEKEKEARLRFAQKRIEAGDYALAITTLESMEDYSNALEFLKEARYELGLKRENEEKYDNAIELFRGAAGYKDADEHKNSLLYELGMDAYINRDYENAIKYLSECKDYKDANTLVDNATRYSVEAERFEELLTAMHLCQFEEVDRLLAGFSEGYVSENPDIQKLRETWPSFDKRFAGVWNTHPGFSEDCKLIRINWHKGSIAGTLRYELSIHFYGKFYSAVPIQDAIQDEDDNKWLAMQLDNNQLKGGDAKYYISADGNKITYVYKDYKDRECRDEWEKRIIEFK